MAGCKGGEKVPGHPPPIKSIRFEDPRPYPEFHQSYTCAREVRADLTFGEQIITIADDARNDWIEAKDGGAPRVNKEVVLRSRLRIAARQLHMSRLQPETWGDRQKLDIKSDWSLLTEEERRRRAEKLISMIRELREPPPSPPPLVYRWEEAPEEAEPGGIGWQPRSATGREG
jgi:terminase small subunit-like protein